MWPECPFFSVRSLQAAGYPNNGQNIYIINGGRDGGKEGEKGRNRDRKLQKSSVVRISE